MPIDVTFKSVGRTQTAVAADLSLRPDTPPLGIVTPLRFGTGPDGIFAMHHSLPNQIADNLRNLIMTNHGERLGLYDFGADLQPLMAELVSSPGFEDEAVARIRTAVGKYMPFIALETFEKRIDNEHNQHTGRIIMRIGYGIPSLNLKNRAIDVVFYVM